ncbi:hypothetical protein V1507DRAFT_448171 [Lipomyces tetrasporus]
MKFSVLIGALLAPLAFSSKLADPVALNKSYNPPLVVPSPVVDFIVDSTTPSQPHRSKRRRALSRFLESHKTSKLRTKSAEETMQSVKITGKRFGMKFMIGRRSKPATSTTTTIAPTTQTSCSPNSGKLSNAKNWRIWKPVIPKPLCSKTGTGASRRGRAIKLEEIELAMAPCPVLDDTTNRRRSPTRFLSIKKKKERAPVDPIPVVAVAADASSILDFDTESDNGTGFSPIATTVVTVPDEIEYADKDSGCFNGQSFLHNVAMPSACQLPELSFTTINWGILESNSDFDISVIQIGAYVEVKVDAAKLVDMESTSETACGLATIHKSFASENGDAAGIMQQPITKSKEKFVATDNSSKLVAMDSKTASTLSTPCVLAIENSTAEHNFVADNGLTSGIKEPPIRESNEYFVAIDDTAKLVAMDFHSENEVISAIMEPIMESIGIFVAKDDAAKLVALAHTNESPLEIDSIEASIAKDSFDSENTDVSAIMAPFTESIGNFVANDDAATPLEIDSMETSIVKDRLDFENADVSATMVQLLESIGNVVAKVDAAKFVAFDHTTEFPEFPLEIDSIETIIAKDSYDSENSDISAIMEPVTESSGNFVAKDDAAKLGALDNTNDSPLEIDSIEASIAKDSFDSENAYVSAVMGPMTESIGNFVGMDDTAKLVTLNHTDESFLEICAAVSDDAQLDSKIESNLETACVHASMAKDSFASENGDASGFMEPIMQSNKQFVAIGDASKLVTVDSTNESTSETACGLAVENGRVNDSFASGNEGASETMKPITESNVVAINTSGMIADEDSAKRVVTTVIQDRQTTFADPTFDVSNKDVTEIPPALLTDDPSTTHESSNLSEPRRETITSPPNCTSSSSSSVRTNSLTHLENVMDDCLANQNYFPSITVNAAHSETETVLESDAAGETAEETEDDSISLSRFDLIDDWIRERDTNILLSVPVSADEEVDVNGIVATTDGVEDDIPAKAIEQAKEAVGAPEVRKPEKHITRTRLPPRVATARHPKLSSDNSTCRVSTRIFHGSLKDFTVSSTTPPYYYPSPYPSPTVFVWPEMRHAIEFGPWPHFRVSTARVVYMLNMFSPPVRRDLVMDLEPDSYLFTIDHDHESEHGCKLCVEHHDYVRHVSCNYEAMLHDMKSEMFRGGQFGNHKWVYDFTGQMARTEAQIWMRYPGGQYYAF